MYRYASIFFVTTTYVPTRAFFKGEPILELENGHLSVIISITASP
jgi:hypothetical protein